MYLASEIDNILESNKCRFLGVIPYTSLARRLSIAFGFQKDLKFKLETYDDIDSDEFTVSGLYDMTTDKKYIILNVSESQDSLEIDSHSF